MLLNPFNNIDLIQPYKIAVFKFLKLKMSKIIKNHEGFPMYIFLKSRRKKQATTVGSTQILHKKNSNIRSIDNISYGD